MSHIDLENFRRKHPKLTVVWDAFKHWQSKNPDRQYLDVREVVVSEEGISIELALEAVEVLLESGHVRQVYKFVHPVYQAIGPDYDSPLKAPDEVPDAARGQLDEWIDTSEAELVPLLRGV